MRHTLALIITLSLSVTVSQAMAERSSKDNQRLKDALKKYPDADANGDGVLTMSEAIEYRNTVLKKKGRNKQTKPRQKAQGPSPDHANIQYGPHERNVIDLWQAKRKDGKPTPLLIYIHGGGFRGGDKSAVHRRNLIDAMRAAGISVASINYRLIRTAPYPAAMHDGARAIQFLRHHAKKFNLDPSRFACTGSSAGGCMSMWLAFHDDMADPKSDDPIKHQSTRIICAAPNAGQSSLDPQVLNKWFGVSKLTEHPSSKGFLGIKDASELQNPQTIEKIKDSSPLTHLTKDDPPVFASYGGADVKVTETTAPGAWVHHPKMGIGLKKYMDELGIECHVLYRGGPEVKAYKSATEFLISKLNGQN